MAERAELSEQAPSGQGWWSSWLSAAKEKSYSALSATHRDLGEFVNVLHHDTSAAVTNAATTIKGYLAKEQEGSEGAQSTQDSIHEVASPRGTASVATTGPYDRSQAQMQALRSNPQTYCSIPEGRSGDFLQWCSNFDLGQRQQEISSLLVEASEIRKLHSELVPSSISYEAFWHHYFYRVHLMHKEESRRAEIMARVSSQDQLIDWEEEEEVQEGPCGPARAEESSQKAMSDSSESFVCVSEEDPATSAPQETLEGLPLSPEDHNSDSEWEKWSDN